MPSGQDYQRQTSYRQHAPHHMHHITCTTSHAPHHMHHITCTTSHAPHHMHHITCTTSHAPHHMHHITCTTSHAPHHMHHITCTTSHAPHHMHHTLCTSTKGRAVLQDQAQRNHKTRTQLLTKFPISQKVIPHKEHQPAPVTPTRATNHQQQMKSDSFGHTIGSRLLAIIL